MEGGGVFSFVLRYLKLNIQRGFPEGELIKAGWG